MRLILIVAGKTVFEAIVVVRTVEIVVEGVWKRAESRERLVLGTAMVHGVVRLVPSSPPPPITLLSSGSF